MNFFKIDQNNMNINNWIINVVSNNPFTLLNAPIEVKNNK
jgi:hypothetical protein